MSRADTDAVFKRHLAFCSAISSQQAPVDFFEPDGAILLPGQSPVKGGQAIQDWFNALFKDHFTRLEVADREYIDAGDVVIETGVFRFSLTPKAGGPTIAETGIAMAVWRRGADGSWRIIRDMSSGGFSLPR